MAFRQPTVAVRQSAPIAIRSQQASSHQPPQPVVEESQEWILFSPSNVESSTNRSGVSRTVGLSRNSDLGSLNTAARSGRLDSEVLDDATEDAELDSLDEGLHAFREPLLYQTTSNQAHHAALPTHDGLGTFHASSSPVLEQLWQHEQFNPKRKHEGQHRRTSSIQRRLDNIEEMDAQANEEKRMRIEKWRMEQSQALMEEVERETRRLVRCNTLSRQQSLQAVPTIDDALGTTPKQSDYMQQTGKSDESEPFWRRITRKFIRDVIGIDDPLLSVILGETLPAETHEVPHTPSNLPTIPEQPQEPIFSVEADTWRDRLLHRIARELGVFVHQLTPHPGAFSTYLASSTANADYAGMPVNIPLPRTKAVSSIVVRPELVSNTQTSSLNPNFPPTLQDPAHAENWGFEEEPASTSSVAFESGLNLQQEREYWERELDVNMVVRYLKDRFATNPAEEQAQTEVQQQAESAARRAAIIRQHHPLMARAHRSPARMRRDSRLVTRRPSSSCASESVKSSRRASAARSGSSRNYWDIGGSVGSGSILASGGLMGAWGEV